MSDIEKDMKVLAKMTRTYIENNYDISGKAGKEGTTFIAKGPSGRQYAIKMFSATKSSGEISKEYALQESAAEVGVAPAVYAMNSSQKYIVMQKMKETIVAFAAKNRDSWEKRQYRGRACEVLPRGLQAQLYALCVRLDGAGVSQNDGNPLNLMLDDSGRLYIIDYGFSKRIDKRMIKKRGPQPNINLTLWHFARQLTHYRILTPLLFTDDNKGVQNLYMAEFKKGRNYKDNNLLAEGERLLSGRRPKAAKQQRVPKRAAASQPKVSKRPAAKQPRVSKRPAAKQPKVSKRPAAKQPKVSKPPTIRRARTKSPMETRRVLRTSTRASKTRIPLAKVKVVTPKPKPRKKRVCTPVRPSKMKKGTPIKFYHPKFKKVYSGTFVDFNSSEEFPIVIQYTSKSGNIRTLRIARSDLNPTDGTVRRKQRES